MKKKPIVVVALISLLFVLIASGSLPPKEDTADLQKNSRPQYEYVIASGTTPTLRMWMLNDGETVPDGDLGDSATLYYYLTDQSSQVVTIPSTATGSGYFDFALTAAMTATNGTFPSQVIVAEDGTDIEWGRGTIGLTDSPATGVHTELITTAILNWGAVTTIGTMQADAISLGGTTNVITDDGINLTRNGVSISGGGSVTSTNYVEKTGDTMTAPLYITNAVGNAIAQMLGSTNEDRFTGFITQQPLTTGRTAYNGFYTMGFSSDSEMKDRAHIKLQEYPAEAVYPFVWDMSTNTMVTKLGLNINGDGKDITNANFYGNGSGLTNVTANDDTSKLSLSGGTMSGAIKMNEEDIENVGTLSIGDSDFGTEYSVLNKDSLLIKHVYPSPQSEINIQSDSIIFSDSGVVTNAIYYGDGAGITNVTALSDDSKVNVSGDTMSGDLIVDTSIISRNIELWDSERALFLITNSAETIEIKTLVNEDDAFAYGRDLNISASSSGENGGIALGGSLTLSAGNADDTLFAGVAGDVTIQAGGVAKTSQKAGDIHLRAGINATREDNRVILYNGDGDYVASTSSEGMDIIDTVKSTYFRTYNGGFFAYDTASNSVAWLDANGLHVGTNSFVVDSNGDLADDWDLGGNTVSNGVFSGDGAGLTNLTGGSSAGVSSIEGLTGTVLINGATNSGNTIYLPAGGVSTIPLNGSSALDWGVLNGTMARATTNGYSTIYGNYDTFRYTDSLPLYSSAGGTITTNYFGCWRDANATVSVIQQISDDNGATWDAVTNAISATTNATVFGLSELTIPTGASLYRVGIETNATAGTIDIYMIDVRGQL